MTNFKIGIFCAVITSLFLSGAGIVNSIESPIRMWEIQSVDTMKTSRDRARAELYNPGYDVQIEKELTAIKGMGANYVAIGTPYDDEFLPYLKRWVALARGHGLKIWFKGNFSRWEGWFGYPKDMPPIEHIQRTSQFIEGHPELFEDGDIFDPCPECENAYFWKQPEKNKEYNEFRRQQHAEMKKSFEKINKNVHSNLLSIIGGRAYEVLDRKTADALGNVITIDHYIKDPSNMGEYIRYFSEELDSKTLVGEFGAPVPDINGPMTEDEQADFIEEILQELYKHRDDVRGINYWVLYNSTTEILNEDYSPRKAVAVIEKYFKPGAVKGTVTDQQDRKLEGVTVSAGDGMGKTLSGENGEYTLVVPEGSMKVTYSLIDHESQTTTVKVLSGGEVVRNAELESIIIDRGLWERVKDFFGF